MALPDFNNYEQNSILVENDTANNLYKDYIAWLINTKKLQKATVAELLWQINAISAYVEKKAAKATQAQLNTPANTAITNITRFYAEGYEKTSPKTYATLAGVGAFMAVACVVFIGISFAPSLGSITVDLLRTLSFIPGVYFLAAVPLGFHFKVEDNEINHKPEMEFADASKSIANIIKPTPEHYVNPLVNIVQKTLLSSWGDKGFTTGNVSLAKNAETVKVDLNKLQTALKLSV